MPGPMTPTPQQLSPPAAGRTNPCGGGDPVGVSHADRLWIADGELVSVRSEHGRIELPARVTERIDAGHVFTAFHFPEVRTNLLVGASADVNTSCPEYKVVAVDVRPVAEEPTKTPALSGLSG